MDDENDKVSRDVVGVPWSHEFLGPHPATLLTWPGHDMVTSDNIDKEDDDKYFEKVPNPHSNLQVDLIHTIVRICQTSTNTSDISFAQNIWKRCAFKTWIHWTVLYGEALLWQGMTIQKWTLDIYIIVHRQFHPKIGPNLGIFMTLVNTSVHLHDLRRVSVIQTRFKFSFFP